LIYLKEWYPEEENCIQNGMALPPQLGHFGHSCQWQLSIDESLKRIVWEMSGFLDSWQHRRFQDGCINLLTKRGQFLPEFQEDCQTKP